jgi:hypothetical protein
MSMRLYFHLVDEHDSILDPVGVEVDDVSHAKATVLGVLEKLRQENSSAAEDWSGWTLHVTNPVGQGVFSIDLGNAVQ